MFLSSPTTLPAFLHAVPATHELRAPFGSAAHIGMATLILSAWGEPRPVLWVSASPNWYPPGLAWAGVDPARCLFAEVKDNEEALGAAEIALRGGMAAIVECRDLSRLAAKRLALAARQGGTLGLVLRFASARTAQDSAGFTSRWMVHPAPGSQHAPRLRAELLYAQGAMPGEYLFEMREEQNDAAPPVVAPLRRTG